ncbi:hypothetical protein B0H10DRAFT_1947828 [Mycena sp. CBHHK59/15]|nr:hypothetical protein B0H10DRAFT_1947828 [Mycena sp. CBHHK59/15]
MVVTGLRPAIGYELSDVRLAGSRRMLPNLVIIHFTGFCKRKLNGWSLSRKTGYSVHLLEQSPGQFRTISAQNKALGMTDAKHCARSRNVQIEVSMLNWCCCGVQLSSFDGRMDAASLEKINTGGPNVWQTKQEAIQIQDYDALWGGTTVLRQLPELHWATYPPMFFLMNGSGGWWPMATGTASGSEDRADIDANRSALGRGSKPVCLRYTRPARTSQAVNAASVGISAHGRPGGMHALIFWRALADGRGGGGPGTTDGAAEGTARRSACAARTQITRVLLSAASGPDAPLSPHAARAHGTNRRTQPHADGTALLASHTGNGAGRVREGRVRPSRERGADCPCAHTTTAHSARFHPATASNCRARCTVLEEGSGAAGRVRVGRDRGGYDKQRSIVAGGVRLEAVFPRRSGLKMSGVGWLRVPTDKEITRGHGDVHEDIRMPKSGGPDTVHEPLFRTAHLKILCFKFFSSGA